MISALLVKPHSIDHNLIIPDLKEIDVMNPFDQPVKPFAGRVEAFADLHQHLLDPNPQQAVLYLGQARIGKTALLQQVSVAFDTDTIPVYLPLKIAPLHEEGAWLRALYGAIYQQALERGFRAERLLALPSETADWRTWLRDQAMPAVTLAIRPHRRIALLLDDAEALLTAIESGQLPADTLEFLRSLLGPQWGIAFTLTDESRMDGLRPCVDPVQAYRLAMLDEDELTDLYPSFGREIARVVLQATGGYPPLAQRFGYHLWEQPERDALTLERAKRLSLLVYADAQALYRDLWSALDQSERLVLTALVGRFYTDPLHPVTPDQIELWSVESDFQLDLTAIYAALRSLAYREILELGVNSVRLRAELFQKWLLEHARLDPAPPRTRPMSPALWIALSIALILSVIIAIALSFTTAPAGDHPIVLTITLLPGSE
ncbi:MAG: hypothetical protein MUF87_21890 [Anaerolineae bacterium]|jgi:hypothetical protein|nr:hypothetical protein [Anaerolineae bacterium]